MALRKLSELEAFVERLPVTADGVRVVEGMTLYRPEYGSLETVMAAETGDYYDPHVPYWRDCYSTPEAAEAAKENER
ncbi:MAG: hypothetical protein RIB60_06190 [Phycisphaerales bacterium]